MIKQKYAFPFVAKHHFPYGNAEKESISSRLRKRSFAYVFLAHVLFIGCPFVCYLFTKAFRPEETKIKVSLIDRSGGENTNGSVKANRTKPDAPSSPVKTLQKPKPAPQNAFSLPSKGTVTGQVPQKTTVAKSPVKTPPEQTKTRKFLDSSEIAINKDTVVKGKSAVPTPTPSVSSDELLEKIRKSIKPSNNGTTGSLNANKNPVPTEIKSVTANAGTSELTAYYDLVSAQLYRLWQQPGKSIIGHGRPSVEVHVTINAAGNILSSEITRKSNIPAMNASVETLMKEVATLPKPPDGKLEFDITLEIGE